MKRLKIWIEAVRLRTLPVSVAGVVIAMGVAAWRHEFELVPAMLCLVFAVLAQVAANLANEYYDFLKGVDRAGREGPRRGVTEGDFSPKTLRNATVAVLVAACVVGCCLLFYGDWWLLPVGIVIVLGALAYSAGPWPLSHHGLGELAVFIFFGLVPVNLTYYVMAGHFDATAMLCSITIGLMGVNVLLVNNYRDKDDDAAVGKRTSVVIFGRQLAATAYLFNGFMAMAILSPLWLIAFLSGWSLWFYAIPTLYLLVHLAIWARMITSEGRALNPLLGATALNMLVFTLLLTFAFQLFKA